MVSWRPRGEGKVAQAWEGREGRGDSDWGRDTPLLHIPRALPTVPSCCPPAWSTASVRGADWAISSA